MAGGALRVRHHNQTRYDNDARVRMKIVFVLPTDSVEVMLRHGRIEGRYTKIKPAMFAAVLRAAWRAKGARHTQVEREKRSEKTPSRHAASPSRPRQRGNTTTCVSSGGGRSFFWWEKTCYLARRYSQPRGMAYRPQQRSTAKFSKHAIINHAARLSRKRPKAKLFSLHVRAKRIRLCCKAIVLHVLGIYGIESYVEPVHPTQARQWREGNIYLPCYIR